MFLFKSTNTHAYEGPFSLCRYVCARPAGKRCFVVSSNGVTVSRLRNGSLLHRFPSALPNGARANNSSRSGQSYCILDCIFHEVVQYVCCPFMILFIDILYDVGRVVLWLSGWSNLLCNRHGLLGWNVNVRVHNGVQIFLVEQQTCWVGSLQWSINLP